MATTAEVEDIDPGIKEAIYGPAPLREPTDYERAILAGLQRLPHVYQGTVDPVTVSERRRRNKAARRSRRINRKAS